MHCLGVFRGKPWNFCALLFLHLFWNIVTDLSGHIDTLLPGHFSWNLLAFLALDLSWYLTATLLLHLTSNLKIENSSLRTDKNI